MKTLSLLLLLITSTCLQASFSPLETVDYVDVNRYLGKWYEIARFEQKFQKGCTAVTAEYKLRRNGTIKVINKCRKGNPQGKLKKAIGRARVIDRSTNAKLKVQFFLKFLNIGFLSGNYWILDLGQDYEYALIGDPTREYLWILSRTKTMDEELYQELLVKARDMEFDTSRILKTVH
jgi:apolipoprotein D and lipocalin family protein